VKKIYNILLLLLYPFIGTSQDIHWSQINENALYLNPANTGNMTEDFRASLSTRDQWRSVTKPYQTQTITFDIINKYNRKLGYGGSILHDVTGDGVFRTIEGRLNTAYTFVESEKEKYKFRIGMDFGWKNNQMNFTNYMFDNQFDGFIYSNYISPKEKFIKQQKSNLYFGSGILFTKELSSKNLFTLGFAIFNINEPNQGFYNVNVPRSRRYSTYIQSEWSLNNKTKIYPSVNYTKQNSYSEFIIGSKLSFTISKIITNNDFFVGTYLRNKDAFFVLIGLKSNRLTSSISYDINFSKLAKASNGKGSLEIHVEYRWNRKLEINLMHKKCLDYL